MRLHEAGRACPDGASYDLASSRFADENKMRMTGPPFWPPVSVLEAVFCLPLPLPAHYLPRGLKAVRR